MGIASRSVIFLATGIALSTFSAPVSNAVEIPKPVINIPKPAIPRPNIVVPKPNITVNVPKPAVTVPRISVDVPRPSVNVTVPKPTVNVPKSVVNVPKVDVPKAAVNVPKVDVPKPVGNPKVDVPKPAVAATVPKVDVPKPVVAAPKLDVPRPTVSQPVVSVPKPTAPAPSPPVQVTAPTVPTPPANVQVATPPKSVGPVLPPANPPIGNPKAPVTAPDGPKVVSPAMPPTTVTATPDANIPSLKVGGPVSPQVVGVTKQIDPTATSRAVPETGAIKSQVVAPGSAPPTGIASGRSAPGAMAAPAAGSASTQAAGTAALSNASSGPVMSSTKASDGLLAAPVSLNSPQTSAAASPSSSGPLKASSSSLQVQSKGAQPASSGGGFVLQTGSPIGTISANGCTPSPCVAGGLYTIADGPLKGQLSNYIPPPDISKMQTGIQAGTAGSMQTASGTVGPNTSPAPRTVAANGVPTNGSVLTNPTGGQAVLRDNGNGTFTMVGTDGSTGIVKFTQVNGGTYGTVTYGGQTGYIKVNADGSTSIVNAIPSATSSSALQGGMVGGAGNWNGPCEYCEGGRFNPIVTRPPIPSPGVPSLPSTQIPAAVANNPVQQPPTQRADVTPTIRPSTGSDCVGWPCDSGPNSYGGAHQNLIDAGVKPSDPLVNPDGSFSRTDFSDLQSLMDYAKKLPSDDDRKRFFNETAELRQKLLDQDRSSKGANVKGKDIHPRGDDIFGAVHQRYQTKQQQGEFIPQ